VNYPHLTFYSTHFCNWLNFYLHLCLLILYLNVLSSWCDITCQCGKEATKGFCGQMSICCGLEVSLSLPATVFHNVIAGCIFFNVETLVRCWGRWSQNSEASSLFFFCFAVLLNVSCFQYWPHHTNRAYDHKLWNRGPAWT